MWGMLKREVVVDAGFSMIIDVGARIRTGDRREKESKIKQKKQSNTKARKRQLYIRFQQEGTRGKIRDKQCSLTKAKEQGRGLWPTTQ